MRQAQPGSTACSSEAYSSSPGSSASSTRRASRPGTRSDRRRLRGPLGQRLAQPGAHRDRRAAAHLRRVRRTWRRALRRDPLHRPLRTRLHRDRARRDHLRREGRRPDQAGAGQQRGQRAAPDPGGHRRDRRLASRPARQRPPRRPSRDGSGPGLGPVGDLRDLVREPREARGPLAAAQLDQHKASGGDAPRRDRRCGANPVAGSRNERSSDSESSSAQAESSSAAASVTALSVSSTRPERFSGGSIGRSAERSRFSTSLGCSARH